MPLQSMVTMLRKAQAEKYAIGLFDVHTLAGTVEAELGHVGRGDDYADLSTRRATFTRPHEATTFVAETGVDALAVAVGSVHGVHRGEPELDLELLGQIRESVKIPLVLHGGSGLSDGDFRAAIAHGISKVYIYTNMALAALGAMRTSLDDPDVGYLQVETSAQKAIKDVVVHCTDVFGSAGQA